MFGKHGSWSLERWISIHRGRIEWINVFFFFISGDWNNARSSVVNYSPRDNGVGGEKSVEGSFLPAAKGKIPRTILIFSFRLTNPRSLIIAGRVSVIALLFHVSLSAATPVTVERRMNNASQLIASRPRRSCTPILQPARFEIFILENASYARRYARAFNGIRTFWQIFLSQ